MTLVCHHPELASNRSKYFTTTPTWRENRTVVDVLDGTIYTAYPVDLTQTFLKLNITVGHFRNRFFKYSCVLTLADEDGDASGSEESEEITVDPVGEWVLCVCTYSCVLPTSSFCLLMYVMYTFIFMTHYS